MARYPAHCSVYCILHLLRRVDTWKFPDLINLNQSPPHDIMHHIITIGPATIQRYRQLDPTKKKIAQSEFEHMMELGIVRPSDSKWASPLHMAKKSKPGDWRPCPDYRALNFVTVLDRYPLPHIHDCVLSLHAKTVLSIIDLVRAYHRIPVHPKTLRKRPSLPRLARLNFSDCRSVYGIPIEPCTASSILFLTSVVLIVVVV